MLEAETKPRFLPRTPSSPGNPVGGEVLIRVIQTANQDQVDITVAFTPSMERQARECLERMFGYVLQQNSRRVVTRYVDKIIRERKTAWTEPWPSAPVSQEGAGR